MFRMLLCYSSPKKIEAMNEKQQQLTFDKGITNVPSDALCSDNALEESLGMVYDDGEHRVIQKPALFMTGAPKILFVHKVHGKTIYIALLSETNVVWGTKNDNNAWDVGATPLLSSVTESNLQVTSVGNTLIIKNGDTINYFLWNADGNSYIDLGHKLPEVDIRFGMFGSSFEPTWGAKMANGGSMSFNGGDPSINEQKLYEDQVVGLYNKNIKRLYQNGQFPKPFVLRYALELYDGSYTHASAPIMMFPSVTENSYGIYNEGTADAMKWIQIITDGSYLKYKRVDDVDLSVWSDIVKDIVVFASDDVEIYELLGEIRPRSAPYEDSQHNRTVWKDGVITNVPNASNMAYRKWWYIPQWPGSGTSFFLPFQKREESEIMDDLKNQSIFYRLFAIGTNMTRDAWYNGSRRIEKHVLENLTTQERLEDDYYSHCIFSGESISSYNNRLLLANVTRSFFEGFSSFLPYDGDTPASINWTIEVDIKTSSGTKTVRKTIPSTEYIGAWYFFYPDPRATEARISGGSFTKVLTLEEHTALNGAFWAANTLPKGTPSSSDTVTQKTPTTSPERLYNEIFVSEVNNPFVFRAEGNITVGNGDILGISTLTQAISQGQFGQYPLIVFTTEGIWAASTSSTGLFSAVHPMSREVCNNPKSITQTDGAVFFSSAKGLMVVVGNDVRNVSDQMAGKTNSFKILVNNAEEEQLVNLGNFREFLASCFIAYDYRDSLLWIFNASYDACYVYSIKSGTFGKYDFGTGKNVTNVINYYPDYLLQNSDGVLSLLARSDINNDGTTPQGGTFTLNTYNTRLITRPMKLENALALKSLMQIRHIKDFTPRTETETVDGQTVTHHWPALALRIFASNNLDHWTELNSLRGTPWKYYRFRYDFTNMIATDRFAGTMVVTQERRTNKMR